MTHGRPRSEPAPDGEPVEVEVEAFRLGDRATFEPRPLTTGRSRSPIVAALWFGAIAALVGAALVGRGPAGQPSAALQMPSAALAGLSLWLTPHAAAQAGPAEIATIEITTPPAWPILVTTRRLPVFGFFHARAADVEVALEAGPDRLLASAVVDVADPDGGIRPASTPTFAASLVLLDPRPSGTAWVVVTAFDSMGRPLGSASHPVVIGALTLAPLRILDWRNF
jgi:hypothetical protein